MFKTIMILILVAVMLGCNTIPNGTEIRIDFERPLNTNIIASGVQWSAYPHADSKDAEWGALMTSEKWDRVYQRLDYIKPGIVRVMDQAGWRYFKGVDKIGNPVLNFDTDEIKALFKVLDYCQKNNIEVIFGEWGAPGYWGEPGKIDRADDPRWIHMITRYLHFLINQKGYNCIKYYNLVNEPNGGWASTNGDWEQWKKGVLMLNDSIRKIGLGNQLGIAGPDAVVSYDNPVSTYKGLQWVDETITQLDSVIGAYDVHAYPDGEFVRSGEFGEYYGAIGQKVKPTGKKLILGELGLKYSGEMYNKNKALAEGDPNASKDDSNMFVYDYFYGLDVVDALIQAMNSGLEGAIAWDLDDAMHTQGDTGDQTKLKRWGMWNSLGTELCDKPEDENLRPWFYTWSLMCRFFPSGMTIASTDVPESCPLRVVSGTHQLGSTVAVLNNSDQPQEIYLLGTKLPKGNEWAKYVYSESQRATDGNGFPIPSETIRGNLSELALSIPPRSFALLSNLKN